MKNYSCFDRPFKSTASTALCDMIHFVKSEASKNQQYAGVLEMAEKVIEEGIVT